MAFTGDNKRSLSFNKNTTYDTKKKRKFHSRAIKSVTFGCETLSYFPSNILEPVPVEIKNAESVACFKRAIKSGG